MHLTPKRFFRLFLISLSIFISSIVLYVGIAVYGVATAPDYQPSKDTSPNPAASIHNPQTAK